MTRLRSRSIRSALLAAALAAVALPALADPDLPDGKWWKRPRIASAIGLTDEQSREIEKIFVHSREKLIDLKADLEKKQLALQSSLEDQGADRRAVEKQVSAVENARAELQKERVLMILDMKQVLKRNQWELLLQMRDEIRERRLQRQDDRRDDQEPPAGRGQARPRPQRRGR